MKKKFAIIGDFDPDSKSHQATNKAIADSSGHLKTHVAYEWIPTDKIAKDFDALVRDFHAFWIAPGGPYKDRSAILRIIEFARLNKVPTLGTCGGFQQMVIEYARNVLHIADADHAEYNPNASTLVISSLACVIKGQALEIKIVDRSSKVFKIFGADKIYEKYYCNFGLNFDYQERIDKSGFKVVGIDDHQEARILEMKDHPFFIATLFVPQVNSTKEHPHPLVTAFLNI